MKKLNEEWIDYVQSNKLSILIEANSEIVDLLLNLRFSTPHIQSELLVSNDYYKSEKNVRAIEMSVDYQGVTTLKNGNHFRLGYYELYNGDEHFRWIINGGRMGNTYSLTGDLIEEYFEEFGTNEQVYKVITKTFMDFGLIDKISDVIRSQPANKNVFSDFIRKYFARRKSKSINH